MRRERQKKIADRTAIPTSSSGLPGHDGESWGTVGLQQATLPAMKILESTSDPTETSKPRRPSCSRRDRVSFD